MKSETQSATSKHEQNSLSDLLKPGWEEEEEGSITACEFFDTVNIDL